MTTVLSGADFDTKLCRIPGCTGTDAGRKGPYAGKCSDHVADQIRRVAESNRARAESNGHGEPKVSGDGSLSDLAKRVVPAAAKLERRLAARRVARDEAKSAFADFKDALDELTAAARTLLQPNE